MRRLGALCAAVCAAASLAQTAGFTPRADETQIPSYELVSIHRTTDGNPRPSIHDEPDGFVATASSLRSLIAEAYGFGLGSLGESQLVGAPAWAKTQLYDIHAKVDRDEVEKLKALAKAETMMVSVQEMVSRTPSYRMVMLQRLLTERFALKVHYEQRVMPLYEMTLAKGGIKLPVAHPKDVNHGSFDMDPGKLQGENMPVAFLPVALALVLEKPVFDKTGASGNYDFKLRWSDMTTAGSAEDSAPSLFTAVQEQMGLKLQPGKGPVWVIVVDHAEMPTEN